MQKLILLTLIILTPFIYPQLTIGTSWIDQDPGINTSLNCVSSNSWHSNISVWICGDNGVILKSNNENESWQMVNTNIPHEIKLVTICVTDSAVLTAGNIGNNTYVYRSADEGNSWQLVFSQPGGRINSISNSYDSLTRIYMSGNPVTGRWSLWKSNDQGRTWDSAGMFLQKSGNETGILNSMLYHISEIWLGTNNNRIYYSSNFGLNWQAQPVSEQNVYCINFYGNIGHAGGNILLFTTDNGNNWNNKITNGNGPIKSFSFYREIMPGIYACGPYHIWYIRENKIYYSCDNNTWRAEHTSSKGKYTSMANNPYSLYAVTDAGRISKSIVPNDSFTTPANSIVLMHSFPNPFNANTNIKFRLYKSAHIKINIYNSAGQLVINLMDENFVIYSVWPYFYFLEVNWDGTNYPSGVYFYQVIADDYVETRKMILVK